MVRVRGEQRFVSAPFEKVWSTIVAHAKEHPRAHSAVDDRARAANAEEHAFSTELVLGGPDGTQVNDPITVRVKRSSVVVTWETGPLAGSRLTCTYEPYGDVTRVASHGRFTFTGVDDCESLRMLAKRFLSEVCATNRELFQWP